MSHTLRGRVVDSSGRPLSDVSVSLSDTPAPTIELALVTGQDGRFSWPGLVAGAYTVLLAHERHTQEVRVTLPQTGAAPDYTL